MAHYLYTLGVDAVFTDNPDKFPAPEDRPSYVALAFGTTSVPFMSLQPSIARQVAVEGERAGLVGAELEVDRLPARGALDDAIGVDREAGGPSFARQRDRDEIVLRHFQLVRA